MREHGRLDAASDLDDARAGRRRGAAPPGSPSRGRRRGRITGARAARGPGRGARPAAAAGPAPAGDRRPGRPAPVRADHHARARGWWSSRAARAAARPPSACTASPTWPTPRPIASRPERMLVVTYGSALAAYISQVLPALGVHGVAVVTYQPGWSASCAGRCPGWTPQVVDDAPPVVTRLKNHPALLEELQRRTRRPPGPPLARGPSCSCGRSCSPTASAWSQLVSGDPAARLGRTEVVEAHRFMAERVSAVLDREPAAPARPDERAARGRRHPRPHRHRRPGHRREPRAARPGGRRHPAARAPAPARGVKEPLAHLFVDEAQDLSPDAAVDPDRRHHPRPLGHAGRRHRPAAAARQRLSRLAHGAGQLGLAHVAVEPLRSPTGRPARSWRSPAT